MDFRKAIRLQQQGQATDWTVLRALVEHPSWSVTVTTTENGPQPLLVSSPEGLWLLAFSQSSDQERWASSAQAGNLVLDINGRGLVQMLTDRLVGLDLEVGTPFASHYKREQFPILRMWGQAATVEAIVRGEQVQDAWNLLRSYSGYHVLLRQNDSRSMVLAPDSQGRKLAAVCAAPDTFAALEEQVRTQLGEVVLDLQLDGKTLFEQLSQMPLDGIVFNPSGPVPPKALAAAFAKLVLQS